MTTNEIMEKFEGLVRAIVEDEHKSDVLMEHFREAVSGIIGEVGDRLSDAISGGEVKNMDDIPGMMYLRASAILRTELSGLRTVHNFMSDFI